jgi:cytochrome c oxidase subunit 3
MSTAVLPPSPRVPVAPRIAAERPRSSVAQTGVWIAIATISMSFAALTSALVVRQSSAPDWQHFQLPALLYWNTVVLLASSVTLEVSRRRQAIAPLHLTLVLGSLFIVGQVVAWRQLGAQRLLLTTGPSSAFFYVFTVLHALHVLGGVAGLGYVRRRLAVGALAPATFKAAALYWHFMAVLWLYLLSLLAIRG